MALVSPGTQTIEYYDAQGLLQRRIDPQGSYSTYEYQNGQLSAVNVLDKPTANNNQQTAGNRYELRRSNGAVGIYQNGTLLQLHQFDSLGRLASTQTPSSGYTIHYNYPVNIATGSLLSITQSDGAQMEFHFDTLMGGRIDELKAGESNFMEIAYDGLPNTAKITDSYRIETHLALDNQARIEKITRECGYDVPTQTSDITQYGYADSGQVNCITQPDGSQIHYEYNSSGYVLLKASGAKPAEGEFHVMPADNGLAYSVINPAGKHVSGVITTEQLPSLLGVNIEPTALKPLFAEILKIASKRGDIYPIFGLKTKEVFADGQTTELFYETSDRPLLVNRARFLDDAQKKAAVRYAVYDTDYDQEGQRHRFLRFEISPEGRVTEYRPDKLGLGNVGSVRTYWNGIFDVSERKPEVAIALFEMQDWVAKQDKQQVSLQEFLYDDRYQVRRVRSYAHIDAAGHGIADESMGEDYTFYNAFGSLGQKQSKQSQDVTTYTEQSFDDLQRLTRKIDALNQRTHYHYLDSQAQIEIIQPNGRVELTQLSAQGVETSVQKTVLDGTLKEVRTTTFARDLDSRPIITQHPDGSQTITFWDRQQRLGFSVSATGIVTEYRYDNQHRSKMTIAYKTSIDVSQLYPIDPPYNGELPAVWELQQQLAQVQNPSKDHISYEFYNHSKLPRYNVVINQGKRYGVETVYDKLNRPIAEIKYSTSLTEDQLEQLLNGQTLDLKPDFTCDRGTLIFYDKDGLRLADVDEAGYVTEYQRDGAGRIIETITYHNPLPATRQVGGDFIRPPVAKQDGHTYYFYDAKGKVSARIRTTDIDAEGNVTGYYTAYTYLSGGLPDKSRAFATPITTQINPALPPAPPVASPEDDITRYDYDLLDREIKSTHCSENGELLTPLAIKETRFDNMGNITRKDHQDALRPDLIDGDHQRAVAFRFDGWGQVKQEINGFVAQLLAQINARTDLTPEQKQAATEEVWQTRCSREVYDTTGLLLRTLDPYTYPTFYFYDAERRPVITIYANGAIIEKELDSFSYTKVLRTYSKQIPFDKLATLSGGFITADFRAYLNSLKNDAKDSIYRYEPDQRNQDLKITDPKGYVTEQEFNAFQACNVEKIPVDQLQPSVTITHEFEPRGLEITTTQTSATQTLITRKEYANPYRKETKAIDELERETVTAHDRLGREHHITDPEKVLRKTLERDAFDRVTAETDSQKNTTRHVFNRKARTETIIYPDDSSEVIQTNFCGEKIKATDALDNSEQWTHAPNGQVASYTDALENKTQNEFDLLGHNIQNTDANQIVATTDFDGVGKIKKQVEDVNGGKFTTSYERDACSNPITITDANEIKHTHEYDQRQSLVQTITDPTGLQLIEKRAYNGQKNAINQQLGNVKNPNLYEEATLRDDLGRDVGEVIDPITQENPKGLAITTESHLDNAGQPIASVDANGNITRLFYDKCGRKRFEINANGGVKEWVYDSEGRETLRRKYDQGIDPKTLTDQTTLATLKTLVKSSNEDTLTYLFYDTLGNERFQINSLGAVQEKRYDKASREIETIGYDAFVDPKLLPTLTIAALIPMMAENASDHDRHQYKVLDKAGREAFTIETEYEYDDNTATTGKVVGYVTQQIFDAMGRCQEKIQFVNPVENPAAIAQLPLKDIPSHITPDADNDRHIYDVFDSRGKPHFHVDGEGTVTRFVHDRAGNLTEQCVFKNQVKTPQDYDTLVAFLETLVPDEKIDHITRYDLDNAKRLTDVTKILKEGNCNDHYELDAVGNTREHLDGNGNTWTYDYDRAKRKTLDTTPPLPVTHIEYDPQQQKLKTPNYPAPLASVKKTIDYDNASNQLRVVNGAYTPEARILQASYDNCNQPKSTTVPQVAVYDASQSLNFDQRPEKIKNIDTKTLLNAKQKPVAKQNGRGKWRFQVHNANEELTYEVDSKGGVTKYERNAFGEVKKKIRYANKTTLDLSQYTQTGIPIADLEKTIKPSPKDRAISYQYGQRKNDKLHPQGRVVHEQKDMVFYYTPDPQNKKNRVSPYRGFASPQKFHRYNAFCEEIYRAQLVNKNLDAWAERIFWRNRTGKLLATAKKVSKFSDAMPAWAVHRNYFNAFSEVEHRVEYANEQQLALTWETSLATLDQKIISSPKDRQKTAVYDQLGRPKIQTRIGVKYQITGIGKDGKPFMQEVIGNLSRQFTYQGTHKKPSTITYEDGTQEWRFYDARQLEIAKILPRRTSEDANGATVVWYPLIITLRGAFGQQVGQIKYQMGAVSQSVPQPKAPDPANDQYTLVLFNPLGNPIYKQDAEENLTGCAFNEVGKPGVQWEALTNWVTTSQGRKKNRQLDAKRFDYDDCDHPTQLTTLRVDFILNTVTPVSVITAEYNVFGEITEEDYGTANKFPAQQTHDNLGKPLYNNHAKGAGTLFVRDLTGKETLHMQSATQDLDPYTQKDFPDLLQQAANNILDFELTQSYRDAAGRLRNPMQPSYHDQGHDETENLPLAMAVGNQYPAFGATSISWVLPQERTVTPKFSIWPHGNPNAAITRNIQTQGQRCGVDVSYSGSGLPSSVYDYSIDYLFTDPQTQDAITLYQTMGTLQFDNGYRKQPITGCARGI